MYGLLLDSIQKFLCEKYGEQYWDRIRRRANLQNHWFVTHEVYSDDVLLDLVNAAAIELGEDNGTVMRMFGEYFAKNIGHYGYARLLRVLGRDLRDFLNGLDDLHEYLRFSYPKMCSPSFFCESETEEGLILHYTTARRGYIQYVIGQLKTVGRIYGKDLEIRVLSEEIAESSIRPVHIIMELKFDNSELLRQRQLSPLDREFNISADTFFGVFPFCIVFDKDLMIHKQGRKLKEVLPDLKGQKLEECFTVRKPMIEAFNWKIIGLHANSVFELISVKAVDCKLHLHPDGNSEAIPPQLRLKGQMLPLPHMDVMAFLCSPVMDSPEELYESGIFVNDLSMHDSSRDMILAGSQKDPELKIALSQEKIRSAQLEESIQQTDRLLFQMIPKPIADQLRNGETPLNTCREFSSVSILFSDIVSFTPMCSRLHPMEVVCVLNAMCVAFDRLCETHHVYKVETVGDAYMVICGAPVCTVYHAEHITAFGLAIIQAATKINDPSTGQSIQVRVGVHSGDVVAGVVGSTVLHYGIFGDTVNVAARMEATGAPMRLHISDATAELLEGSLFVLEARDAVPIKGKGLMNTFWVTSKTNATTVELPPSPVKPPAPSKLVQPLVQQPHLQTDLIKADPIPPTSLNMPKPDEWPQAKQQLQKFFTTSQNAIDYSVPQGGAVKVRRNTTPRPPPELQPWSADQTVPSERVQARRNTDPQLLASPSSPAADTSTSSPKDADTSQEKTEVLLGCPLMGQDEDMSELNLFHVRASSDTAISSITSAPASLVQMEQLAKQMGRNAQQLENGKPGSLWSGQKSLLRNSRQRT